MRINVGVTFVSKRDTSKVNFYLRKYSHNRGSNRLVHNSLSRLHKKTDAIVQVKL